METSEGLKDSLVNRVRSVARKLILTAFSLFLIYQSYSLLNSLLFKELQEFSFSTSFLVAGLLNLFITGVFALFGFAWPSENLLPKNYYQIKNAKRIKRYYRILKVEWFRKMLMLFFWGHKKNKSKFFNGKKSGLKSLIKQTKKSEFGHLTSFIGLTLALILCLIKGYTAVFIIGSTINFIGNFYPIILQRQHRSRISPLFQ